MPFKQGKSGNPKGKPKGSKNKITLEVKQMIIQALNNKGGVKYLEEQADKSPTAFLALVGKILPLQLTGENGEGIKIISVGVEFEKI